MTAPLPSAYVGRDHNPLAIGIRLQYPSGEGMDLVGSPDGGLSISARPTNGRSKVAVKDRGTFDGFVVTEYVVVELGITIRHLNETLTQADAARVLDFFNKAGFFASATDASDVPGTFELVITYANKSTRTLAVCEGEIVENHAFPSNTLALTIRSHSTDTTANI